MRLKGKRTYIMLGLLVVNGVLGLDVTEEQMRVVLDEGATVVASFSVLLAMYFRWKA